MKIFLHALLVIGIQAAALPLCGQTPAEPIAEPAKFSFQNREIVTFRSNRGAFSPRDRKEGAESRLRDVLRTVGPGPVTVMMGEGSYDVLMGGTKMFSVLPTDVEPGEESAEATAKTAAHRLDVAVRAWSDQWRLRVIATGILDSLIALSIAVLLIWIVQRVRILLIDRLCDRTTKRIGDRAVVKGVDLLDPLLKSFRFVVTFGRTVAIAAILYLWLAYAFSQFPLTAPLGSELSDFITDALLTVSVGFLKGVPAMLLALLILVITRFFAHMVETMFDAIRQGRATVRGIYPDTIEAVRRIAVVLVWVFGIAIAFPFLPGSSSEAFKGVSVLFGLMITLGSSGLIGQAMNGLVVVFSRAIKENEYVRVGEHEGTVIQVGALSAKIRTVRNEEITIPNSVLMSKPIHNYSRLAQGDGVVLQAKVGIGYDAPWREVHDILIDAARRTKGLRLTPPPYVRQTELAAFCVEYTINAYLERPETRLAVLSELHANIQDEFNEHEIQIMTPAFENQPAAPVLVPKTKLSATPKQSAAS